MALPAGVTTFSLTFGRATDFEGGLISTEVTITPSHELVWAATDERLVPFVLRRVSLPGESNSIELPHTDQPGFIDSKGAAITDFWYEVVSKDKNQSGKGAPAETRRVQATSDQVSVDLDRFPVDATVGPVGSAPIPGVTSVNGDTGAVIVEAGELPEGLLGEVADATQALATRLSEPQLKATIGASVNAGATGSVPPKFVRANGGAPVFTAAAQSPAPGALAPTTSGGTIYWPCVIDAKALVGTSALDQFYLYYSTDHGSGGIWLATGPTELGPWTGRGRIVAPDVLGTGVETPTVFADPSGVKKLVMLAHGVAVPGALGSQTTISLTSDDGLAWASAAIAIDIPAKWARGDGHTGYAKITTLTGGLIAHHLANGADYPVFGISRSADGRAWYLDSRPLMWQMDVVPDGRRVEWNTTNIVRYNGQLWWVGLLSNFVSAGTAKDARLAVAPISEDLRTLLAPPTLVLYPTAGAETTNYRDVHVFTGRDGSLIMYYQSGQSFYAAIAERG